MTSWLLTQLFWSSFSSEHPWKVIRNGKRFTLKEWKAGRTDLCKSLDFQFALMFWVGVVGFVMYVLS